LGANVFRNLPIGFISALTVRAAPFYRWFPSILKVLTITRPETLVRWHTAGFRCYWSMAASSPAIALRGHPVQTYRNSLALQNGFAEPLIGSIRPECVDHHCLGRDAFASGPEILRHLLQCVRTHRSLDKDAPVTRQIQRIGSIRSRGILGELHH
jgi:hypothetical protein